MVSHYPTVEFDSALLKACEKIGADLVVMASDMPGIVDYLLPSHGGRMASHAGISIMMVRKND